MARSHQPFPKYLSTLPLHFWTFGVILLVAGVLTFTRLKRDQTPIASLPFPTPVSTPVLEGEDCKGEILVDKEVGFSITCPANLKLYTSRSEFNEDTQKHEKIIFLCDSPVTPNNNHGYYQCQTGGVMVWANGDGWGGMCQPSEQSTISLNGQQRSFCLSSTGFSQLYLGETNKQLADYRFMIMGSFSESFTKEDALKVIQSFKAL